MNDTDDIEDYGRRFGGVKIDRRVNWRPPWRIRLLAGRNQIGPRGLEVYGETYDEAFEALKARVQGLGEPRGT